MNYKIIAVCLIVALVSFSAGYSIGTYYTIRWGVKVAARFIDIDEDMITRAIIQYKNNIGGCLFTEQENDIFVINGTLNS